MKKRLLVGCECSGIVRQAFRRYGVDAWSCDILPAEDSSQNHLQCDVRDVLNDGWDGAIFFPDCTYVCVSGMHWTRRGLRDPQLTEDAIAFFQLLLNCSIPLVAIENPVGVTSTRIRPPNQWIQPYQFGHDASKKTGLWLRGFSQLIANPTEAIAPRLVGGRKRWGNQTDSGQNKLGPSDDRWIKRARTYKGIADAMGYQWSGQL